MGLSENRVYSQWNSHLIRIMISKTIGFRGTLFSDTPVCMGSHKGSLRCSFWAWELMVHQLTQIPWSVASCHDNGHRTNGQKPVLDTPIHIKFYWFYHHYIQLIFRLSSQFSIVHWLSYPDDGRTATSRTLFSPLLLLFLSMFPWFAEILSWVKSNFWIWLNDHDSPSPFGDEPPNAMGPFKWRKTTWGHRFFNASKWIPSESPFPMIFNTNPI